HARRAPSTVRAAVRIPVGQRSQPGISLRSSVGGALARPRPALADVSAVVWMEVAHPAAESAAQRETAAIAFLYSGGQRVKVMIILLNPRSTKPKNRRY